MDAVTARNLVKNTFEQGFDKQRFIYFTKNLLNSYDETKAFQARGYVKDKFKKTANTIKTYERLGTYIDQDNKTVDILVVYLERDANLDRSRTTLRNFVADYLKQRNVKDGALVAFVPPDSKDWRFSFVKMDYHLEKKENGRIVIQEDLSPARRYSYLVGKSENTHTAQKQFLPLLIKEESPNFKTLEDTFSVEVVTKEFFEKYKQLFISSKEALDHFIETDSLIQNDFQEKSIDTVDFVKKLLGQIVFLYFLQRKGWFGVPMGKNWGDGDKRFLRSLYNRSLSHNKNYFNDYLEPLFYEALAKDRDDDFYSRFNCRIPFLNGGLFDPIQDYDWVNTTMDLPNDLFSNNKLNKEGDVGTGILDVFDRYNFTVKEDEPLEKEVAVDPEMLGKVFENLLEVKDRKSKGTYYTPREIVHYMCQESLVNYLVTKLGGKVSKEDIKTLAQIGETAVEHDARVTELGVETETYSYKLPASVRQNSKAIDEALVNIRVCDPAVGSGAFLVGMMTEIIRVRNTISSYLTDGDRSIYNFKHYAIQNSLYGVDIDPGAIEIAKLRLWLSLIVDEQDIKQIKPLPNLDYKIMQGNSLLEEYEGIKLFDEELFTKSVFDNTVQTTEIKEKMSELQREFIELHSKGEFRSSRMQQIEAELKRYSNVLKKIAQPPIVKAVIKGLYDQASEAKQRWDDLKRLQKEFFDTSHKKEKDRIKKQTETLTWDFIKATLREQGKESLMTQIEKFKKSNFRPFFLWKLNFSEVFEKNEGFDVIIANPPYVGNKGHKDEFQSIQAGEMGTFYQRRMDLFYFFFHLGLNMTRENGVISFITTNYYPTASGATTLRTDIKNRAVITKLINFNELKIFESALGQHNMITMLKKAKDNNAIAYTSVTSKQGLAISDTLESIISGFDKETKYYQIPQKNLYDGEENYIRLSGASASSKEPVTVILNKIKTQGVRMDYFVNVNQGIVSGADKVSNKHLNKFDINADKGDGIFVLSPKEVANKGISINSKHVKPWFKNSDIRKYWSNASVKEYLLYFKDLKVKQEIEKPILHHFIKYKELLISRLSVCKKNKFQWNIVSKWIDRNEFYLLFYPRRQEIFESPKIVVPQRSHGNTFGFNEIPWYASADVYFITEKDKSISLKYVLALLNSKLYYLWLYHRGKRKGETLELYQKPLSEIPIKRVSHDEQQPFIDIVDRILVNTDDGDYLQNMEKQNKVKEYEKQIDQLAYNLYDLTLGEIAIVEGGQNGSGD